MQSRCFEIGMAVLLLLAGGTLASFKMAEQRPKQDPPQPLPKEIVTVWEKAGATPGWLGLDSEGNLGFQEKATGLTDEVPGFQFGVWRDGIVAKLPAPAAPFGLNLSGTKVTDAGLKELAGLKNLHTL
ncbi:MAG: hypothetical protein WCO91_08640, partial [Gemmataceae bacterium]